MKNIVFCFLPTIDKNLIGDTNYKNLWCNFLNDK